jgi:hypothetical protein
MLQEHILASIGAVGPLKPLHRAIPKSAIVDRQRTAFAHVRHALPTGRHEHVEILAIGDPIEV